MHARGGGGGGVGGDGAHERVRACPRTERVHLCKLFPLESDTRARLFLCAAIELRPAAAAAAFGPRMTCGKVTLMRL